MIWVASVAPHAGGSGPLPPCPQPRELAAQHGHTRRVTCEPGGHGAPVRGPARVLFGLGIDPNRAEASTLEALPGIGPARAAAIVAGREDGAYRSLADLGRVRGIGPVTLRRIASWLAFDAAQQAPGGTGSLPRKAAKRPRSEAKPSEAWAPAKECIGRMQPP